MRFAWLLAAALLLASPASAQRMMVLGAGGAFTAAGPPAFTGPGDVVASATAYFGMPAYSAAYVATPGNLFNVRRASDSVSCDFLVSATGGLGVTTAGCNSSTQGGVSFATFAPTDATASCTIAGTAATCSGASATIHVSDPVSGTGISQPCVVTVTNGSTTATVNLAGTSTTCGTVGVAETVTFTVAAFVTKAYDQTGNSHDAAQATAGNQPQLLPTGPNNSLPILYTLATASQRLLATISATNQPITFLAVTERVLNFTSFQDFAGTYTGSGIAIQYNNAANKIDMYAGGPSATVTAADGTLHTIQGIVTGASSLFVVDGAASASLSPGANATTTSLFFCSDATNLVTGYCGSGGMWPVAFNSTQYGNMETNVKAFWGTP